MISRRLVGLVAGAVLAVPLAACGASTRVSAAGSSASTLPPGVTTIAPHGPTTSHPEGVDAPTTLPASVAALAPPPSSVAPSRRAQLAIPMPSTECADVDLSGTATDRGPNDGQGANSMVISVVSSVTCYVDGYPTLSFGSEKGVKIVDGSVKGGNPSRTKVAVTSSPIASFLVQFESTIASKCPPTPRMEFGIPGTAASVEVSLGSMGTVFRDFSACGNSVHVTPFVQGIDSDIYSS